MDGPGGLVKVISVVVVGRMVVLVVAVVVVGATWCPTLGLGEAVDDDGVAAVAAATAGGRAAPTTTGVARRVGQRGIRGGGGAASGWMWCLLGVVEGRGMLRGPRRRGEASFDGGGPLVEFVDGVGESDELAAEAAELGVVGVSVGDDVLEFGDGEAHLRGVAAPGAVELGHLALEGALPAFESREPHDHVRDGLADVVDLRGDGLRLGRRRLVSRVARDVPQARRRPEFRNARHHGSRPSVAPPGRGHARSGAAVVVVRRRFAVARRRRPRQQRLEGIRVQVLLEGRPQFLPEFARHRLGELLD
mmetsp:Transcript_7942/g.26068  ORF Transcript_7942/g.26068 Transcript_7942/m.26068 type:complete len:305 (-) Transcript_7942:524-1438(-)